MASYPGVYLEERPGGVRPIEGVPTSTTAFVGRALRGPSHQDKARCPVEINSYGEFERIFGGLWSESTLGFAVRDFFLNGGTRAVIVRVYKARRGRESVGKIKIGQVTLKAASPGAWGGKLRVRIDYATRTCPAFRAEVVGKPFNLTVKDMQTGQVEVFRDISVARNHPRHVAKVLEQESALVKVEGKLAGTAVRPRAHAAVTTSDSDPFSDRFKKRYASVSASDLPDDGLALTRQDVSVPSLEASETGLYALRRAEFNLLCIPPLSPNRATNLEPGMVDDATAFCEKRRAFFLIDPPWHRGADVATAMAGIKSFAAMIRRTSHGALYFPTIVQPNPLNGGGLEEFAPCGAVAGVIARTDTQRGVWKAPAGLEATLGGMPRLSVALSDRENAELNPLGINCLRKFSGVHLVWGARTIEGNDRFASEWKYVPVRRMALFIEESLYRGTQWVVFEPNDESLWAAVRLSVGAFLLNLFRQGAFQGRTPKEAYFVKCDTETTTPADINLGFVNILVGFAPLKPAEFVVIKIRQMAGQIVI